MKRLFTVLGLLFFGVLIFSLSSEIKKDTRSSGLKKAEHDLYTANGLRAVPDFGKIPLYFIQNCGQVEEQALFYAKTSRYTLWVTKEGLVFDSVLSQKESHQKDPEAKNVTNSLESSVHRGQFESKDLRLEREVSRLIFRNANRNLEVIAVDPAEHKVNYFIGNDTARWKKDIPTSLAVLYKGIYPGIDLKLYGRERQIEYDWVVKPGAHVEDIQFEYKDVGKVEIDRAGNLVMETGFGKLVHHKPSSYQRIEEERVEVASKFKKYGNNIFGFAVNEYKHNYDLVIDPVILVYSTYLGGSSLSDCPNGIAVDSRGAAYVTGYTSSSDFPLKNPYQDVLKGESDVFVTKFTPAGNDLAYSTYLGGYYGSNYAYGIAVDSSGAAYVTGYTDSPDFPLKNPYQSVLKAYQDVFVTKFTPSGNDLVYSTFLGGSYSDGGYGIAVDSSGAAYVTGYTSSPDFPLKTPYQDVLKGESDVFVTKFTPTGDDLVYSTYLGGSRDEEQGGYYYEYSHGIAVDSSGAAYVTGYTDSSDFPLKNPYQDVLKGRSDVFVTKFTPTGDDLIYSTYLGGFGIEMGSRIAVDSSGAAYVTGWTNSREFPLKNPYQNIFKGETDVFVTKFTPTGNDLAYSTYLGGSGDDGAYGGIAVDSSGAAYVAGVTFSKNFPLKNPYQSVLKGDEDVFVTKFTPAGNALVYSTFLGGSSDDGAYRIAVDSSGAAYVTGDTDSSDFPLKTPYQDVLKHNSRDGFVTKLITGGLTVTSPNGNETWKVNAYHTIKWKYSGPLGSKVIIELFKGKKLNRTIVQNAAIGKNGKGSYRWKIPANQTPGGDYKIRVTSKKYTTCTDTSDRYFKITNS